MARAKFLCDAERCIECNACVTACKNEHEVPWGINRRRVVTLNDGSPGERSISVACMHCSDAPCMAVCPVDCFYQNEEGVVLHSKDVVRWTNVPFVPAGQKKPIRMRNSANTVATGLLKVNCRFAPKCVQPKRCWRAMAILSLGSIVNASWLGALVRAHGAGARPITKKAANEVAA